MKKNKYFSTLKSKSLLILIAFIFLFWGILTNNYTQISIGLIILIIISRFVFKDFKYIQELHHWILKNENKIILFYPTKNSTQENIQQNLIPKIPFEIMEVYYDGPKIVGDIKRSVVHEMIKWNSKIDTNFPAIIKVKKDTLLVEELFELIRTDLNDEDYLEIIDKIKKVKDY
ncbi:hypothetical protein [Aureivirga sp. CE67]|uniref:hypothetical protein n=1 Tax=Aureivirga sp. CE67 TaxID=1788983 RepID=UPI0018C98265|nr:hypothetical protein [Aureivirga sp. CE67]